MKDWTGLMFSVFFFSSRRRHTRYWRDWSSDVCSSDLIAAGVAALVGKTMGDTPLGKIVATAAPILVMTIATFMILDQLKIAETIVTITYGALLGAIALGSALAFGLGGRDVAREMLQGAYQKGQENKDQFKQDLDQGMQRGKDLAGQAQERMQGDGASTPPQPAPTGPGASSL